MIEILKCGHDSNHQNKFNLKQETGVDNYILLFVKTDAYFYIQGEKIETHPNMIILYNIASGRSYESIGNYYNDDWIHFKLDKNHPFLKAMTFPFDRPIYLSKNERVINYIRLLVKEFYTNESHKAEKLNALMEVLLYTINSVHEIEPKTLTHHRHYDVFEKLRSALYGEPHKNWTVNQMADFVHLSPSYFQHLYKDIYRCSCINELINARIERSKYYLSTTKMKIKDIALSCGYENEQHFIRQFKQKVAMTPKQYRDMLL